MAKTASTKGSKGLKATKAPTGPSAPELASLRVIAASVDVAQLRRFQENAKRAGSDSVGRAASRRLVDILPARTPGNLGQDFHRTTLAVEELVAQETGKATRVSKAKPKPGGPTVHESLAGDASAAVASDGFVRLIERGFPEMTGEAIVLRHQGEFSVEVVAAATRRLSEAGVDIGALPTS